ncbi:MAG: hypothetical protein RQ736_13530 [Thiogranum sp.]|nr:hypothetical protein [Thiogranum sp.]
MYEREYSEVSVTQYVAWITRKSRVALLFIYFIFLYTALPLSMPGGAQVPAFWVLSVTSLFAVMFGIRLYKADLLLVASLLLLAFVSVAASVNFSDAQERLPSIALLLVALVNGVVFVQLIDRMKRNEIEAVLLFFIIAILCGSALEVLGLLRDVSDSFRVWAFSSEYVVLDPTAAYERDMALAGFIRPNLFTTETSNLAKGFLVFSNAWLLLGYSRSRLAVAALCNVFMLAVTGSLVILVSLAIVCVMAFLLERNVKYRIFIGAACVGATLLWLGLHNSSELMVSRLHAVADGYGGNQAITSVVLRLVYPFITLRDVIVDQPYFGVGIGGTEMISQFSSLSLAPALAVGNNGFANLFIYFGLVGFLWMTVSVLRYLRSKGVNDVLLFVIIVIGLLQVMGDAWTIRVWAYVFLFVAILRKRNVRLAEPIQ